MLWKAHQLAQLLVSLCAESSSPEMPMVWIFLYFFEPRILECLPSFTMLDYQVRQLSASFIRMIRFRDFKTTLGTQMQKTAKNSHPAWLSK